MLCLFIFLYVVQALNHANGDFRSRVLHVCLTKTIIILYYFIVGSEYNEETMHSSVIRLSISFWSWYRWRHRCELKKVRKKVVYLILLKKMWAIGRTLNFTNNSMIPLFSGHIFICRAWIQCPYDRHNYHLEK